MEQVICDHCKKEIPRAGNGMLEYFRVELARVTLGKDGDVHGVPTTEIEADLCGGCKVELDKSFAEANLKLNT